MIYRCMCFPFPCYVDVLSCQVGEFGCPYCQPLYTYINQLMRASGLTIHQEALLSYSMRADLGIVNFLFNRK